MNTKRNSLLKYWSDRIVVLLTAVFAVCTVVTPVAAQERSVSATEVSACTASVTITTLQQMNLSIRVNFNWTTVGSSGANALVEMLHHPSGTLVYTSGFFPVSPMPNGSMQHMIVPPGGLPYPAAMYRVRVRLFTKCGANSQFERFIAYTGTPVLEPIVQCNTATAASGAPWGLQCMSFVPNGHGGYTLNYQAITDADPQGKGLQHPFLGVGCTTQRNGTLIERYEVEHPLGSQQGNAVEFGATNGVFWQTGFTAPGVSLNLPTTVPAGPATYNRQCFHWAGFNDASTSVTVTLP
ncbi:MAG: hypothetical protein E6Q88_04050 [Lysobacteraceae bacterium]|nr:MAG: hypothetical protein E6Q88_04050 [Xanthomonadaceae bacterium]